MPLVIIKEFETDTVITGYHAYMNDWTPISAENLSTRPERKNEIDEYVLSITKDRIDHFVFYFLSANPMNTTSITVTGEKS